MEYATRNETSSCLPDEEPVAMGKRVEEAIFIKFRHRCPVDGSTWVHPARETYLQQQYVLQGKRLRLSGRMAHYHLARITDKHEDP